MRNTSKRSHETATSIDPVEQSRAARAASDPEHPYCLSTPVSAACTEPCPTAADHAMTTQLENSAPRLSNSLTSLARFPANKAGPSLLSRFRSDKDCVIVTDARLRIVLTNSAAERLFGYPGTQLLDKPLDILAPPQGGVRQLQPTDVGRTIAIKCLRSDGATLRLKAAVSRISIQGEQFLAVVAPIDNGPSRDATRKPALPAELRRWAANSQQAAESEKRRYSRKLYDDIGQRLSVLKLDLDWLENSLAEERSAVPARVARMQGLLDNVIAMTKSMASSLRPPLLDDFGLLPAVEWIVENMRKRTGISCTIESTGMDTKLDDAVQSAVFRLVQEALSNVERHSRASHVEIRLHHLSGHVVLTIRDDGVGMPEGSENKPGCYGLVAMQERVFVLGGTISVRSDAPYGVTIHASIPIEPFSPLNNSPDHVL